MQRSITIVLGIAAVLLTLVLTVKNLPAVAPVLMADAGAQLTDGGGASPSSSGSVTSTASTPPSPSSMPALRGAADASREPFGDVGTDEGASVAAALTGAAALDKGAPRQVRIGVVLVEYVGAQGASPKARSKRDALVIAQKLAADAQTDFRGAVQHGDPGSSDDIGHIQHGVLDAPTEAALFALPIGGVSDVIDTPRGYWVAKRLE